MAVDIALHPIGPAIFGNTPIAPALPLLASEAALEEDAESAELVVPHPGAYLVLVPTAKLAVDVRPSADAANLDPATSGLVLASEERAMLFLSPGSYKLKTAAYS